MLGGLFQTLIVGPRFAKNLVLRWARMRSTLLRFLPSICHPEVVLLRPTDIVYQQLDVILKVRPSERHRQLVWSWLNGWMPINLVYSKPRPGHKRKGSFGGSEGSERGCGGAAAGVVGDRQGRGRQAGTKQSLRRPITRCLPPAPASIPIHPSVFRVHGWPGSTPTPLD